MTRCIKRARWASSGAAVGVCFVGLANELSRCVDHPAAAMITFRPDGGRGWSQFTGEAPTEAPLVQGWAGLGLGQFALTERSPAPAHAARLQLPLDRVLPFTDNPSMEKNLASTLPPELMTELQEAADRAARGVRDPEIMRRACESMDRLREEIRRRHGVLDIGVPAIRELRDGA